MTASRHCEEAYTPARRRYVRAITQDLRLIIRTPAFRRSARLEAARALREIRRAYPAGVPLGPL